MSKHNVLFIFVDSVRRYYSDDDRSRLEIMDFFSAESIECLNMVTSAPSTFMSISAMMSGMPAYCLNRNYNDFKFDNNEFQSLPYILEQSGYKTYNFWMAPISRVTMSDLLPCVPRKYWPKGFKHSEWWSNSKINKLVQNTLKIIKHHQNPNFFFLNYNCREDEKTSDIVSEAIDLFRNYGYSKENTVTILCSDHGYPDPLKETGNPSFYKLNSVGHDLVLTDDNIMIPFSIQIPGLSVQKITSTFSTLDIFPTVLDILNIDIPNQIKGKSMLPIFTNDKYAIEDNKARFHRCDSRLAFQQGKGTAIRNGDYKYIYYHDNFFGDLKEEFFDLKNDPLEGKNLIETNEPYLQSIIQIFKNEFSNSENHAMLLQEKLLSKEFKSRYSKEILKAKNILIVDSAYHSFINFLSKVIRSINTTATVKILNLADSSNFIEGQKLIYDDCHDLNEIISLLKKENTDLIIFPTSNLSEGVYRSLLSVAKKENFDMLLINYNLIKDQGNISYIKRVNYFLKKLRYLVYEPKSLLNYVLKTFKRILIKNKE